jgi:hypothetical protein
LCGFSGGKGEKKSSKGSTHPMPQQNNDIIMGVTGQIQCSSNPIGDEYELQTKGGARPGRHLPSKLDMFMWNLFYNQGCAHFTHRSIVCWPAVLARPNGCSSSRMSSVCMQHSWFIRSGLNKATNTAIKNQLGKQDDPPCKLDAWPWVACYTLKTCHILHPESATSLFVGLLPRTNGSQQPS